MRFLLLDTSAAAKLYRAEQGSGVVKEAVSATDAAPAIARLALVELESVFATAVRTGTISETGRRTAKFALSNDIATGKLSVLEVAEAHFTLAQKLIEQFGVSHGLRTLDALQLAVALQAQRDLGPVHFVCADARLCRVAREVKLPVLNPLEVA